MKTQVSRSAAKYAAAGFMDPEECVLKYAPLVKRIAHHMMATLPPSVQVDDMIQSGMLGLIDAAKRYQESQGAQFETYAVQRIRGAMLDSLRQSDWRRLSSIAPRMRCTA